MIQHFERFLLLLGVLLLAYALPWVNAPASGLSFGAYDLAEWASLHPAVRAQQPELLTSLFLRFPLACLAIAVGFLAPRPVFRSVRWWIALVAIGMFVLSSLPPLEFFVEARRDVNYRQQFLMAAAAAFGGLLGLSGWLYRWRIHIAGGALLLGLLSAILGFLQGYDYLLDYEVPVQIGAGSVFFILLSLTALLDLLLAYKRTSTDALMTE